MHCSVGIYLDEKCHNKCYEPVSKDFIFVKNFEDDKEIL